MKDFVDHRMEKIMRTYLVTGGAGFIGSNYIHYMFRKYDNEIRIINVDVLTYAGNLENLKDIENRENYTFVRADITDKEAIAKIFAENEIDRVVHFAAESHVKLCKSGMGAAGWQFQRREEIPSCIDG